MVEQLDITLEHQPSAVSLFCHVAITYTTLSGHSIHRYRKFCIVLLLVNLDLDGHRKSTAFCERNRIADETTLMQLYETLVKYAVNTSVRTVLQTRQQLGWTYRGSAYCQLIREANQVKRLEWARTYINDDFENVIWSDEATVQLGDAP